MAVPLFARLLAVVVHFDRAVTRLAGSENLTKIAEFDRQRISR
jgi:hypothetical protein